MSLFPLDREGEATLVDFGRMRVLLLTRQTTGLTLFDVVVVSLSLSVSLLRSPFVKRLFASAPRQFRRRREKSRV